MKTISKTNKFLAASAAAVMTSSAWAGGLVTNTNQNASFLRQLSQEAIIDINGMYANPAGIAFLAPGAHVAFNIQSAKQNRDVTTSFPLMAYSHNHANNPSKKYHGNALAPIIPSVHFSYNWEKWSVNSSFALTGGGGKCEFDEGLGTFESLYSASIYSGIVSQLTGNLMAAGYDAATTKTIATSAYQGYKLNAYMKGRSYYFGWTVGGTYKVLDNLAAFVGGRLVYATNNYNGWVEDIAGYYTNPATGATVEVDLNSNALSLNTDQTGFGFTPMLGVDWKMNDQWNFAAKYEFKTRLRLENKSEMNDYTKAMSESNATLGQFKDGSKVAADIPATFFAGAQYAPIEALRFNVGYHWYGDKNATQYGDKQDKIDNNTYEFTAGAEYDINRWVTASCGWQITRYGLSEEYMNDLSFVTNSQSYGLGARVHISDKWSIDLGFMQTLYQSRDITTSNFLGSGLDKTDHYKRTNRVFGIGMNFDF